MVMKVKDNSIKLDNLHISMQKVIKVVDMLWKQHGEEAVITSGCEVYDSSLNFIHSAGSLHYYGRALDFRTRYFTDMQVNGIATRLRETLGNNYDVVVHSTHMHIEYDPKD
jgi:hypothetical protein